MKWNDGWYVLPNPLKSASSNQTKASLLPTLVLWLAPSAAAVHITVLINNGHGEICINLLSIRIYKMTIGDLKILWLDEERLFHFTVHIHIFITIRSWKFTIGENSFSCMIFVDTIRNFSLAVQRHILCHYSSDFWIHVRLQTTTFGASQTKILGL